jgi:transcriptional regulator with XRE-family HTH domain
MPRRIAADELALAVQRIRELRLERGLTIQALAEPSDVGSKGQLSSAERGRVRPSIQTSKQVADGLGVQPFDLLTFPKAGGHRHRLVEITRSLGARRVAETVRWLLRGRGFAGLD